MYALDDYYYDLPEALIAQEPLHRRDLSRLFCLRRESGRWEHRQFGDIAQMFRAGDVLVLNDTRVIPGRLLGRKASGGRVELLILDYARGVHDQVFECLIRSSKRPRAGSRLFFDRGVIAQVLEVSPTTCRVSIAAPAPLEQILEDIGHIPLPPYIRRADAACDRQTYQTVYAEHRGAIAAPTAGLHFSTPLLERLADKGVELLFLTLHVGFGTFVPVRVDDIRAHRMHAEWFELSETVARRLNTAKHEGRRVLAVGTTSVRTLEFCTADDGVVAARSGMCDLFIYPGFHFRMVDGLITNFHLPRSTLLMLVSAFAGRENVLQAYAEAVRKKYRFFSYGDAMFIS
jgi:S-adenosylmethionine:tRNA ribosyltransferase-isomerase